MVGKGCMLGIIAFVCLVVFILSLQLHLIFISAASLFGFFICLRYAL